LTCGYDATVPLPRHLTAELFVAAGATLAEGPSWDAAAGCLLWVDILAAQVHLTNLDGTTRAMHQFDRHVGAALPIDGGGGQLVVRRDGFALLGVDGSVTPLLDVLTDRPDLRFNDAKCDPRGRAVAGTMAYDESSRGRGELLLLAPGPKAVRIYGPTSLSNGLGWSPDGEFMYFIDTPTYTVTVFDYRLDNGRPSRPRPLVEVTGGMPDGLCVDDDGCLWVALWGGAAVHRYTPQGRLDAVLQVPAPNVTSCAFAPDGRLYVTTASVGVDLAEHPHAGSLFVADVGVGGPLATPWLPV
jgi:sugar lactone lactonase YvrE